MPKNLFYNWQMLYQSQVIRRGSLYVYPALKMAMAVVTSVNQFDSSAQRSQTNVLEEVALRIKRRAQSAERGTYDNTGFYRRQQIGPLEITRVSSQRPKECSS